MNDVRLITTAAALLCALAGLGSWWPALDLFVPAAITGLAVAGWASWALRRELRIRRRLADPRTRPAVSTTRQEVDR